MDYLSHDSLLLRLGSFSIEQNTIPAIHYVEVNIKLIDYSHRDVIDHVIEVLRVIVESRHRWQNHHTHPRQFQHVFEMYLIERRLAHDEHKLPPLFQDHVRSTM